MTKRQINFLIIIISLLLLIIFTITLGKSTKNNQVPRSPQASPLKVTESPTAQCHLINGVLPDPKCTPGTTNPNVNQADIQQTICLNGYTKTIRPPEAYTTNLKKQQIQAYGYADTNLRDYEEDHLISLELGGSPNDPKNLWPEPGASPNTKDRVEDSLHTLVCDGRIQLSDAQNRIATNWVTALSGF